MQDLGGVAAQSDLGAAVVLLLDLGDADRQRLLIDGQAAGPDDGAQQVPEVAVGVLEEAPLKLFDRVADAHVDLHVAAVTAVTRW